MLAFGEMVKLAKARLTEARILHREGRHDGAVYLCGYAVEIGLKCKAAEKITKWRGFPETDEEFRFVDKLKSHKLEEILTLVGMKDKLIKKPNLWARWQQVCTWNSDYRYKPIGSANKQDAQKIIRAAELLLRHFKVLPRSKPRGRPKQRSTAATS